MMAQASERVQRQVNSCKGEETSPVRGSEFGNTKQEAYDALVNRLVVSKEICEGGCSDIGQKCIALTHFDEASISFAVFRNKAGRIRWIATYDGTVTLRCDCVPSAEASGEL